MNPESEANKSLTDRILAMLQSEARCDMNDVHVSVNDGHVVIRGSVANTEAQACLIKLIWGIPQVRNVSTELQFSISKP